MIERRAEPESEPITRLLEEWSAGSDSALRELLPLVYERMRHIARSLMRRNSREQTTPPAALVGELYVRLASALPPHLTGREHFFSLCARTMRRILIDHARSRLAGKRRVEMHLSAPPGVLWLGSRDSDALDLDRARPGSQLSTRARREFSSSVFISVARRPGRHPSVICKKCPAVNLPPPGTRVCLYLQCARLGFVSVQVLKDQSFRYTTA